MWTADENDVLRFRSPGGDQFAKLIGALLHQEAANLAIPLSEINTTLRTTLPDGGVDAMVASGSSRDTTGWLGVPSIWQFKATMIPTSALKREIDGNFCKDRIKAGFGYRLCVCEGLTPQKIKKSEATLDDASRRINASGPSAKVITASAIAVWLSKYPGLYLEFIRPPLVGVQPISIWGESATAVTRTYVNVSGWEEIKDQILRHVSFQRRPGEAVLPVLGTAGVGKTRLVYETLQSAREARGLTLYTPDEEIAKKISTHLLSMGKPAILVADECSQNTRYVLNELLKGRLDLVRVVAIDNEARRSTVSVDPAWLETIPQETVLGIMAANFPQVPEDRRRAYATLSKGFVRIAADLCQHHDEIEWAGAITPAVARLERYYEYRVSNEDDRRVIEALALVTRVGAEAEMRVQLEALCQFLKLDPNDLVQRANRLREAPGFVVRAGRFYYITPEPIARIAFSAAYRRWIESNRDLMLRTFPPILLDSFLSQVAQHAGEEVRRQVGESFREDMTQLTGAVLADTQRVRQISSLIEADPATYLPLLRRVVDSASRDELLANNGSFSSEWAPRRTLVWVCETMARFPEHFAHCEAILWRLAQAESEPNIGNNATGIWKQLFQIVLSGSATPFLERLKILEGRASLEPDSVRLVIEAINGALSMHASRMGGRETASGRFLPADWRPKTGAEFRECIVAAIEVLQRVATTSAPGEEEYAGDILIARTPRLLAMGAIGALRRALQPPILSDVLVPRLQEALEEFLGRGHYWFSDGKIPDEAGRDVRLWLDSLQPKDFDSRLLSAVGKEPWRYQGKNNKAELAVWTTEIESLAREAIASPQILERKLAWLFTERAASAGVFGEALGRMDSQASVFDLLTRDAESRGSAVLVRWYLTTLVDVWPQYTDRVNEWLDRMEKASPQTVYEVAVTGGNKFHALERVGRLIDEGKLKAGHLRGFVFGHLINECSADEFARVLLRLRNAAKTGDGSAARTAIALLEARLERKATLDEFRADQSVQSIVFDLLVSVEQLTSADAHNWGHVLEAMSMLDFSKAARVAASGLAFRTTEEAARILAKLAKMNPGEVMDAIGTVILDPELGISFFFNSYRPLFSAFPEEVVRAWLQRAGVEGARKIARHLPLPTVDSADQPIVPSLTEYVLSTFADDDRTFREFCAGTHALDHYFGDIALQHLEEARLAERFLQHPLRRIREWAQVERRTALQEAEEAKRWEAEVGLP